MMPGLNRGSNYTKTIDSLNSKLKLSPNDTTSLFYRSLFYLRSNDVLSKPYQTDPKALTDLKTAQTLIEKALMLGMQNFKLKVLRAEVYASLCYRFGGDEAWKFKQAEISARRKQFNEDKGKANQYYDELAKLDPANAYDYQRRLVKTEYPVK
jgi:hypothetical protein